MDGSITPGIETQPPAPGPLPPEKKQFILGSLGVALGVFLAVFRAWAWSYGVMTTEAWGFAAGAAFLPLLIAYAIAGRKSVRNFNRFGVWFSGLSLVFFLITGRAPVSMERHIGDLMKEAAGTKPVDNSGPETMDNMIREMMRGILDDRKAFERETAAFAPDLRKLYSIDTFSNPQAMQKSIDVVHGIVATDERYSKLIESIPDRMEASVDRSSLSDSDKRDFMEGVRKSFGDMKLLQIRRQAVASEKLWEDATVGLYEFAMANAAGMRVDGAKLRIGSEKVRVGFNDRLDKAQKLRADLAKLNTELETAQRASLQQEGLTPKDLGLKDSGQGDKK